MGEYQLKEVVRRRWEFIEFCLNWERAVGRKRLQDTFGISLQQATNDLNGYADLIPGNMIYDPRQKTYVPSESFAPQLTDDNPYEYLRHVSDLIQERSSDGTWLAHSYETAGVVVASRQVSSDVLRAVLKGITEQRIISALYISLSSASPAIEKRIVPRALAYDGHRWHTRAYNVEKDRFSDYVLSRFERADAQDIVLDNIRPDDGWIETVDVHFIPNPKLDDDKRKSLEYEYQMENSEFVVGVKRAMLFYYLRQYGFNPMPANDGKMRNESSFNLVIKNFDEIEVYLERR